MSLQIYVSPMANSSYLRDSMLRVYETSTVTVLINTGIMEGDTLCPSIYALARGQIQAIYMIQY